MGYLVASSNFANATFGYCVAGLFNNTAYPVAGIPKAAVLVAPCLTWNTY